MNNLARGRFLEVGRSFSPNHKSNRPHRPEIRKLQICIVAYRLFVTYRLLVVK